MTRKGFSVIELLMALVITSILTTMALPVVREFRKRAMAVHVIGDFKAVGLAARDHFATHGEYPMSADWDEVPEGMEASLPDGFVFRYGDVEYRWRRWALPNGLPGKKGETQLLGFEVQSDDEELLQSIRRQFKGTEIGDAKRVTMLIE